MTDLTDKWKKGGLPDGYYYCKTGNGVEENQELKMENKKLKERLKKTQELELEVRRENTKLKELLKECELWFTGIVGNMNDKNVGEHNRNLPIGNFENMLKNFSQKINQTLGEDK